MSKQKFSKNQQMSILNDLTKFLKLIKTQKKYNKNKFLIHNNYYYWYLII